MWNWYSGDETGPAGGAMPSQEHPGTMSVTDLTEQLAQTEQLVVQLKDLIREKDNELRKKDERLKEEKETVESRISKAKLQNKAKIASLTSQLEELKKQLSSANVKANKPEHKKASGDGDQESASANRGKILVLRKRVEELETQLSLKNEDLLRKEAELETQRLRGSEMDAMLAEKEKKLAEKEAYIIELQVSSGANLYKDRGSLDTQVTQRDGTHEDLQLLMKNLTRKVEESEERCSLLQEQADSLKSLLQKERSHFQEREAMYMENIRVFQGITQDKEKELQEQSQKHEQELFKLLAKSDASADLHQLLKALKQKLHEEEEVLLGKNQVIGVLQAELDHKDQQLKEMSEQSKRLQSERENLQSKLDAEKHVMRAQLRDLMEKHETELHAVREKHELEVQEKCQTVLELQKQLQNNKGSAMEAPTGYDQETQVEVQRLQDELKLKTEEASKSEAKFLKMKAWSKSRIRQLEEELKTLEDKNISLSSRVSELEHEKQDLEEKLSSLSELRSLNEQLLTKLVHYEEQQRKMQADLEQVAHRTDSQTSESGSVDELHHQLLEWNEMNPETEGTHVASQEEKVVLAMRMAQMEEDREAMDSGQQELEEELSGARGVGRLRQPRRKGSKGAAKLQDEFDFNSKSFEDQNVTLDSIDSANGENMGGLRIVVEELELERNQLQDQIMTLEERCRELEERVQLQARIESLQVTFDVDEEAESLKFVQSENERLQSQLLQLRQLHSREADQHYDLTSTLNQQLKSLTDRNAFLESAILEKEQLMLEATGKAEQVGILQKSLQERETCNKEVREKLDLSEQKVDEYKKRQTVIEAENVSLKVANEEMEIKLSAYKERVVSQENAVEKLQLELEQTNEELDKLNSCHLEERSQLIYDLQRCEREVDVLKEALQEKDKEMSSLSASLMEYTEQALLLKEQIYSKEHQMREMGEALAKAERECHLLREAQSADIQETSAQITSLSEQLHEANIELNKAKYITETKTKQAEELIGQINENDVTINNLGLEVQAQSVTHSNHIMECSAQIASLKEQVNTYVAKCEAVETNYKKEIECLKSQLEREDSERTRLARLLEEKNNQEQRFENELKLAKEQYNQVISGISKKDEDFKKLSKQFVEQKEELSRELQIKEHDLSLVQKRLETVIHDSEGKIKTLQENTEELKQRLREKSEVINKIDAEQNVLLEKNKLLETTISEINHSIDHLEGQRQLLCTEKDQLVKELSNKESEISSLNQELQEIERKLTDKESEITLLNQVLQEGQSKITEKELEMSSLNQTLQEAKGKITDKKSEISSLNQALQEAHSKITVKESEISSLNQALQEAQNKITDKKSEISSLNQELQEAQNKITEKESKILSLTQALQEAQSKITEKESEISSLNQVLQEAQSKKTGKESEVLLLKQTLQEAHSKITEKESEISSVNQKLAEAQGKMIEKENKNSLLNQTLQEVHRKMTDVAQQLTKEQETGSKLQLEKEELREKVEQLSMQSLQKDRAVNEQLEERVKECLNLRKTLKEEQEASHSLQKEIRSLENQIKEHQQKVSEKDAELEVRSAEYHVVCEDLSQNKEANSVFQKEIEKLSKEMEEMRQELYIKRSTIDELQTETDLLKQHTDTLKVDNTQLSSSIELMNKALSSKADEINTLSSHLSQQGHTILSLKDHIDTLLAEKQTLILNVEERDLLLHQKKELLQEMQKKLEGEGLCLQTLQNQLQSLASEKSQLQQLIEDKEIEMKRASQEMKLYRDKSEEAELLRMQLSEHMVLIAELQGQAKNLSENIAELKHNLAEKDTFLKQKVDDYTHLNAHFSEAQVSLDTQRKQIDSLILENEQCKSAINEGELARKQLALAYEEITQKAQVKEGQCEALMQQVTHLQEINTNLNSELNDLKNFVKANESSLSEKETLMISQLEERSFLVSSLQDRVQGLTSAIKSLEHSLTEKEMTISNLQEKYASLYERNHEREQSFIKKDEEISKLLAVASEKDVCLQVSESSIQALTSEACHLREELENSVSNLNNISEVLKEKDHVISINQQSLQAMRTELDALKVDNETAVIELRARTQEIEQKEVSLQSMLGKCSSHAQLIVSLQSEIDHLNSKLLQDQQDHTLHEEQLQLMLENIRKEKVLVEEALEELRQENENSISVLQNGITEKAEHVKELEGKLNHQLKECEAQILNLKTENADLQKQVSGKAEEICELNLILEKCKQDFSNLQQKSEQDCHSVIEQNDKLTKLSSHLEKEVQLKENNIQSLLKDLHFVEEQLRVLCDEKLTEYATVDTQADYRSNREKFFSMFSVAFTQKSSMADFTQTLVAKEKDIAEKLQLMISFQNENASLHTDLQKIKQDYNLERQALVEQVAEKDNTLAKINAMLLQLQEETHLAKNELGMSQSTLEEERNRVVELLEGEKRQNSLMQNLNVQLNQQKELISALTDQMKDKDASLTQIMQSMSSEILKFSEERTILNSELESSKSSLLSKISDLSVELEESKTEVQKYQKLLTEKEDLVVNLESEKGLMQLQLEKFSKEKENLKRKLQAALVVRKDLMQKFEKLEVSKQEDIQSERLKTAEVKRVADELSCKLQTVQNQYDELEHHMQLIKKELLEREQRINKSDVAFSDKERLVEELQSKLLQLQHSLSQKEDLCQEHVNSIQEKELHFQQIKVSLSERINVLQEENSQLLGKIENMKSDFEKIQEKQVSLEPGYYVMEHLRSSSRDGEESVIVHNNVHASLLCNNGNAETTERADRAALLGTIGEENDLLQEEHSDILAANEEKCKKCDQSLQQVHVLQEEVQAQKKLLQEKALLLSSRDLKLEGQKAKMEEILNELQQMKQDEVMTLDMKSLVQEKEAQLVQLNSALTDSIGEIQVLKGEIQKLTGELERKQEETAGIKSTLGQLDQCRKDKEMMEAQISLLQTKIETVTAELESFKQIEQQISHDKETYVEAQRINQVETEKLKHELGAVNFSLLEKNNEIAHLQASLETISKLSEEESQKLQNKLDETQKEAEKLKIMFNQMEEEMHKNTGKLEKANIEISNLQMKLEDSYIEDVELQFSTKTDDKVIESLQATNSQIITRCEECLRKENCIEDLEKKVMRHTQNLQELTDTQNKNTIEQESRRSEEISFREQLQRKLQAALLSRKDIMKENKALKQKVEALNLERDDLKRLIADLQEQKHYEISSLSQKTEDLQAENTRLLVVNENLSAACESLKSTMENIVQEKEAFSFQLNSLKDSQTDELSGWKAKHGELNKEYESLLQAYENITDEIDKMRQVIEVTKKEKYETLQNFQKLQSENHMLGKQIREINEECNNLRKTMEFKEQETQVLQNKTEKLTGLLQASKTEEYRLGETSCQNSQLIDENKQLKETCESLKLLLEKEKENYDLLINKIVKDHKVDMEKLKIDTDRQMSQLQSENEVLCIKLADLSKELNDSKQHLVESTTKTSKTLEKLNNMELNLEQEKLARESDLNKISLENMTLNEKVKILEDDKSLLMEEVENIQDQMFQLRNERDSLETEFLNAAKKNDELIETFKSLQAQTNYLSQQVECLRAEKGIIIRERENEQLQLLREFEERVRCAQKDSSGKKSQSKELQELLKEKQLEINQLQKDSIKFQELILDLEGSLKDSSSQNVFLQEEFTKTQNEVLSLTKELSSNRSLLEKAEGRITKLTVEVRSLGSEPGERAEKPLSKKQADFVNLSSTSLEDTREVNSITASRSPELVSAHFREDNQLLQLEHQHPKLGFQKDNGLDNKVNALQKDVAQNEQKLQQLMLEKERFKADLEKQLTLSQNMKKIIDNKDKEISELISTKDGEISGYIAQVQQQYRKQVEDFELQVRSFKVQIARSDEECQKKENELKDLQVQYEKAINDKNHISNEIQTFRKCMSSLQTDRDLLSSELKNMHIQHDIALSQRDNVILTTTSENENLKKELKNLLNQLDDFNAENAMLGAQLVRYREDLNQVLSLKDHQLKELIRQKLDHIKSLEEEKRNLQKENKDLKNLNNMQKHATEAVELENKKLTSKVRDQELLIAEINKEKILRDSRKDVSDKNVTVSPVEEYNLNMTAVEPDVGLLKKELNSVKMPEKPYWDIYNENKQLASQNETFGKAMAALQNDRDSLIEDFKELQSRYASELRAETIRADDLQRQLEDFKSQVYSLLKTNSFLSQTLLAGEHQITLDQLSAEIQSLCVALTTRSTEVSRLSSECGSYSQQISAFSKSMASLQHERERLLQQLRDAKQVTVPSGDPLEKAEPQYLSMTRSDTTADSVTLVSDFNYAAELLKLRSKVSELEGLLQDAKTLQEAAERETSSYQCELAELRSEKNLLVAEAQALRLQFNASLAEKEHQIAELHKTHQESAAVTSSYFSTKNLERAALAASPAVPQKAESGAVKSEAQRLVHEIHQRDLIIQQLSAKARDSIEMNAALSAQLKTVSQGLRDTQMRYSDLQRDCQDAKRRGTLAEVPPGAPQERDILVDIDSTELMDLRRRLAETELSYDAIQQELSLLSERLTCEKTRREAAEEALMLAEQQSKRLETSPLSREYEFSLQMESDDEREALIIDPTQHVVVRKMRGGALALRQWLRGRSLYCSRLLTSRGKSRYMFFTYLLLLHALVLMCLTGVL
ncbi:golgin subfamily B member 1 isoform X2 [Bombina bombina]|uniref:golgin subfamily B member 1 isoform X2 n=1 Tax=Bombina bombina TaxID=8345 RepID=UPI00235AF7FF|nr:golgin subfamily B member 1 isoform X2 [Bombina bombina]